MDRPNRPEVQKAVAAADGHIQSLVGGFQAELNKVVMKAQAKTVSILQKNLTFGPDGKILKTPANKKALAKVRELFRNEMNGAGYGALTSSFAKSFNGTLPLFQDTLNAITSNWVSPPAPIEWTPEDLKLFVGRQATAKKDLHQVVNSLAAQAQTKSLFSFAGLSFDSLTQILAKQFGKTLPQAEGIAATSLTTYYRTISDKGFKKIEKGSGVPIFYTYEGPDDKLTRPFCKRVLEANKPFSREEINEKLEKWDGHSLPNVMQTCGGYNCRHQWVLYSPAKEQFAKLPDHLKHLLPPDFDSLTAGKKAAIVKKLNLEHGVTSATPAPAPAAGLADPAAGSAAISQISAQGTLAKPANWDSMTPGQKSAWTKKAKAGLTYEPAPTVVAPAAPAPPPIPPPPAATPFDSPFEAQDAEFLDSVLEFEGVAKIGGAHYKEFWKDDKGQQWLFKPYNLDYLAEADEMAYKIGRLINPDTVPTYKVELNGKVGSIQKMVTAPLKPQKDFVKNGANSVSIMTAQEIAAVQKEQVFDWLISNHDAHGGQFLRLANGGVIGIDKAQAFKFFPKDELSISYHPNTVEKEPIYNSLWKAAKNGHLTFNPHDALPAIQAIEKISDTEFRSMLSKYAYGRFGNGQWSPAAETFLTQAVARKNSIRKDFEQLYSQVLGKPFTFAGSVSPIPAPVVTKPVAAPAVAAKPAPLAKPENWNEMSAGQKAAWTKKANKTMQESSAGSVFTPSAKLDPQPTANIPTVDLEAGDMIPNVPLDDGWLKHKPAKLIPSTLGAAKTADTLNVIREAGLENFFGDHKLDKITFTEAIAHAPTAAGSYLNNEITIGTKAASIAAETKLRPGVSDSINFVGPGGDAQIKRSLLHEIAHHVRVKAYGQFNTSVIDDAFLRGRAITKYAATNAEDYFAENFVAYHYHHETLKAYDPVGFKMIQDARARLGLPDHFLIPRPAPKPFNPELYKNIDWRSHRSPTIPSDRVDLAPKLRKEMEAYVASQPGGEAEIAGRNIGKRLADNPDALKLADRLVKVNQYTMSYGSASSPESKVAELAKRAVDNWNGTSAGNTLALHLQRAAEEEFGLDPNHHLKARFAAVNDEYQRDKEGYKALVRAMWENTQEWFAERGITSVWGYRGMHSVPSGIPHSFSFGRVNMKLQPISSFSANQGTGASFGSGGVIVAAEIPVGRIISVNGTGFGTHYEREFVVMNGSGEVWANVVRNGGKALSPAEFEAKIKQTL